MGLPPIPAGTSVRTTRAFPFRAGAGPNRLLAGGGLKVLMLAPSLPFPPHWAAGIRRYEFLKHLSARHDVSLLTYVDAGEAANVGALGDGGGKGDFVDAVMLNLIQHPFRRPLCRWRNGP